jgi:hypothetical protein
MWRDPVPAGQYRSYLWDVRVVAFIRDGTGSGLNWIEQISASDTYVEGRILYLCPYPRVKTDTHARTHQVSGGYQVPVGSPFHM